MKDELLVNAGVPKGLLVLDHEVVVCPIFQLAFPHLLNFLLRRGEDWVVFCWTETAQSVLALP
jgi:hypothetical protein